MPLRIASLNESSRIGDIHRQRLLCDDRAHVRACKTSRRSRRGCRRACRRSLSGAAHARSISATLKGRGYPSGVLRARRARVLRRTRRRAGYPHGAYAAACAWIPSARGSSATRVPIHPQPMTAARSHLRATADGGATAHHEIPGHRGAPRATARVDALAKERSEMRGRKSTSPARIARRFCGQNIAGLKIAADVQVAAERQRGESLPRSARSARPRAPPRPCARTRPAARAPRLERECGVDAASSRRNVTCFSMTVAPAATLAIATAIPSV